MSKSMFDRTVDFKMEETFNAYIACRALSLRARDINIENKAQELETGEPPELNPTAEALGDYSNGRIVLNNEDDSEEET